MMRWLCVIIIITISLPHARSDTDESDKCKCDQQLKLLSRQVMMQQLFNEERIRSEGDSGVKVKRHRHEGTRPYYSDSYTGLQFLSIHDHANHLHTIGLGEFTAVLNGVEFRTRHNDYGLYMPSTKTNNYHETEEIPLPDVPPEVSTKKTIEDQMAEMRLWFKAFKERDRTTRDYRKYFKPVLCYLEGAWTHAKHDDRIDEPFISDRHSIMAADWDDLHRKIRFTSYSGSKNNGENLAYLPTSIIDMVNDSDPIFAQWNYRIMCHPLTRYVDTDRLRVVDDLAPRMAFLRTLDQHALSRSARFQLNSVNDDTFEDGHTKYTFLDLLMSEIPGKENYRKFLRDESFGLTSMKYTDARRTLNAARYHRWYQFSKPGAMGRQHAHRGFSDSNVFMALNKQPKVVPQTTNDECRKNRYNTTVCLKKYTQRWSYAIPLEIIYLTPLGRWNPYDIEYNNDKVQDKKRKGGKTRATAFSCASSKLFYRTPTSFFRGTPVKSKDAADTSGRAVGMLNRKGELNSVMASGVYTILPEIEGVGEVRTRYPIAPVHQEGSSVWKEVQALRDLLLLQESRLTRLRTEIGLNTDLTTGVNGMSNHKTTFSMAFAKPIPKTSITGHTHTVTLTADEMKKLKAGQVVEVMTSEASSHSHKLQIKYNSKSTVPYSYIKCDDSKLCFDKHGVTLKIIKN